MDTQIPKFPEMWTFASHVEITSFDILKTVMGLIALGSCLMLKGYHIKGYKQVSQSLLYIGKWHLKEFIRSDIQKTRLKIIFHISISYTAVNQYFTTGSKHGCT